MKLAHALMLNAKTHNKPYKLCVLKSTHLSLIPVAERTRTMPGALSLAKLMNEINESSKSRG